MCIIPGVKKYLLGMDPESGGNGARVSDAGFGVEAERWFQVPPVDQVLGESFVPAHELGDQVVDGFPV